MGRANSIRPYRGGDHGPSLSMILCRVSAPLNHRNGFSSLPHSTHVRKSRNANNPTLLLFPQRPPSTLGYAAAYPAPSTEAFPNMPRMSPEPDPQKNTSIYSPKQNHSRTLPSHFVRKKERAILKNIKMTL